MTTLSFQFELENNLILMVDSKTVETIDRNFYSIVSTVFESTINISFGIDKIKKINHFYRICGISDMPQ